MSSLTPDRAVGLAARFPGCRLLVVGDVMIDEFLVGEVSRISPEAPVPVVRYEREEARLGGAANVAHNARAFGAEVDLVGLVGRDAAAERVAAELRQLGIGADGLVHDETRPTTRKVRIVTTRHQQVARLDYESEADAGGEAVAGLVDAVRARVGEADVVVVSDYLKGVVTAEVMTALVEATFARGVPLLVDPKIPHIDHYRGASLVTPNQHEAEIATSCRIRTADEVRAAARAFQRRAGCASVLITRGEHGMFLLEGRWTGEADPAARTANVVHELELTAVAREVADVTGAGDTVIATIGLALAAGASLAEAAALANYAAGVAVGKFGSATVSAEELCAAVGVSSS
jgi:D-glycero-beta-D-manno-heptose-7-phosphate kinase